MTMPASSHAAILPPPPKTPAAPAPRRAPGSVRRTSSIDVSWPEGRGGPMHVAARARDIATRPDGAVVLLGEGAYEADLSPERAILSIAASPPRADVAGLAGERAGGHLRKAIAERIVGEKEAGTPLYLILDDLSGASLVSPWAWSLWDPEWLANLAAMKADPRSAAALNRENICIGLATGSSGLALGAEGADTPDLRDPADPDGWHAFAERPGAGMRRARRIDVTVDDLIRIDAHFQDSAARPGGGRSVLHEYGLTATADPVSLEVRSIVADPRVLPFAECPGAARNVTRLVGTPLPELRERVLAELRGTAGCTHLNDALRSLAEAAVLAGRVEAAG